MADELLDERCLKCLYDMRAAARTLESFIDGRCLEDLQADNLFRSAVYWQLMILGEALSQMKRINHAAAERVEDHRRIIGFRNQIVHGYARIDDEITWSILQTKLPGLCNDVDRLLSNQG